MQPEKVVFANCLWHLAWASGSHHWSNSSVACLLDCIHLGLNFVLSCSWGTGCEICKYSLWSLLCLYCILKCLPCFSLVSTIFLVLGFEGDAVWAKLETCSCYILSDTLLSFWGTLENFAFKAPGRFYVTVDTFLIRKSYLNERQA